MARARALASVLFSVALVAGCGGASTASPSTAPTPVASATPAPTATPEPSPVASATPAPTATPSPTSTPAATATPEPTATPTPAPTAAAGFSCSYPLRRSATTDAVVPVEDVRVGTHAGYDRVVFELSGTKLPELRLDTVAPPFEQDPSGLPLTVPGASFVRIQLVYASGEGYANPDGRATYTGPVVFKPAYPRLTSLVRAGDFEGHLTWIAGLTGPACYHVFALSGPSRLVIDFQAP